jgi:hypothetical protein
MSPQKIAYDLHIAMVRRLRLHLLVVLLFPVLTSSWLLAQGDDEDADEGQGAKQAYLALRADANGQTHISLTSSAPISAMAEVRTQEI